MNMNLKQAMRCAWFRKWSYKESKEISKLNKIVAWHIRYTWLIIFCLQDIKNSSLNLNIIRVTINWKKQTNWKYILRTLTLWSPWTQTGCKWSSRKWIYELHELIESIFLRILSHKSYPNEAIESELYNEEIAVSFPLNVVYILITYFSKWKLDY